MFAFALVACGGNDTAIVENQSNDVETVDVVEEVLPAQGSGPGVQSNAGNDITLEVEGTPEQRSLAEALSRVPDDKRRALSALLECEEGRLAAPVPEADRPAFVDATLAQLTADPTALQNCLAETEGQVTQ